MDDWEMDERRKEGRKRIADLAARKYDEANPEYMGELGERRRKEYIELMARRYDMRVRDSGGFYAKPTLYRPYNLERGVYARRSENNNASDSVPAKGSDLKKSLKREK